MPGGDGTGPNGEGPMTGRGLGRCRDNDSYVGAGRNYGYGRYGRRGFGFGFGRGFGFGFRRGPAYYAGRYEPDLIRDADIEREIDVLKDRLSRLEKMRDDKEDSR